MRPDGATERKTRAAAIATSTARSRTIVPSHAVPVGVSRPNAIVSPVATRQMSARLLEPQRAAERFYAHDQPVATRHGAKSAGAPAFGRDGDGAHDRASLRARSSS